MAIALNSVIQFILRATYGGSVRCLNRFYYQVSEFTEITDPALLRGERFARGLWRKIGPAVRAVSTNMMLYESIDWAEYDLTTGQPGLGGTYAVPTAERFGTSGGDTLPPFVALTYRLTRPSTDYRNGYKRFAGVPEQLTNNGFISAADTAALNLATALAEDIGYWANDTVGAGIILNAAFPVLIRKTRNGQTVLPQQAAEPAAVQLIPRLGSQNTRKYGRGS